MTVRKDSLPRLLTLRAISDASSIPRSTLYDLVTQGKIPVVRVGASIRVAEVDWLAWIESHRVAA